ncbi:cysteine hydrolase family protein [Methyloversatilis thermotolerans]|uniref:cysteine hydrolase family protein n=1 Tax=Methyloversatilis thermotolerans TaxID=1346290 RepID=UPI00037511B5|nr:cysteine hydrolase family protein [Methyloversatilis thermotolerans]
MSAATPTLRDLSGLDSSPAALSESALILIDCQQTYREGVMQLSGVEPALLEAAHVLSRARETGRPVIHIQHDAGPGSPYDIRGPIGRIAAPVTPVPGEAVITKHYPNSFVQTVLDEELKRSGIRSLVLVGFMTHMCVNSTARGAFNLGYQVTVVASATATRDLPGPGGALVPAAALQTASLAMMGDLFAAIAPSSADLPD